MGKATSNTIEPLQAFRVVNFGWYWAGPLAGQALGDMGAQLITVESRKRLTAARFAKPFFHGHYGDPEYSLWGHNLYRSALSITLDMGRPKGRDLFKGIVRNADVLIVNFAAGVMERLGLGWQDLRGVNPTLVMVYMSAVGLTGPMKNMQLFGSALGAAAGLDAVQGYEGEEPMSQGAAVPDPLNGMMGAFAALAALRLRQRTGQGRLVDLSQQEALTSTTAEPLMDWWLNKRLGAPLGNRNPRMAPHGLYPSRGDDCWVAIAIGSDEEWRRFCKALGSPAWAADPRFATLAGRLRHQDDLDRHIAEWTRERTHYEATRLLQAHEVAAFPALNVGEICDDPHFQRRGTFVDVDHAHGRVTITGVPWQLSETPGHAKPNHPLGTDNRAVYCDLLGVSEDELRTMEQEGVLT